MKTAEEAITESLEHGDAPIETVDESGQHLMQRPMSIEKRPRGRPRKQAAPAKDASERVRIYHKRKTRMFLTDCVVGPHEEASVLRSDIEHPNVKPHVVIIQ